DLVRLYQLLTLTPEEVEGLGGAGEALDGWGVASISVGGLRPSGATGRDSEGPSFPHEQLALWERLRDPAALAADLLSEAAGPGEEADPRVVLRQIATLASGLPDDMSGELSLYDRLQEVISHLPPDLRRRVLGMLIERLRAGDALAQRLVGM